MAKMFYTLDETKAALAQSEDQIKQLTRDGRLREFRDGPRLMFKADQVDALKGQISGLDPLGMEDSGAPLSLADTGGGTGAPLTLADSVAGGVSSGSGLAGISGSGLAGSGLGQSGSGLMNLKEDTALAADLGLSGTGLHGSVDSLGGTPSPAHSSGGSLGGSLGGLSGSSSGGSIGGGSIGGGSLGGSLSGTSAGTAAGTSAGSTASTGRQGVNVFGEESHFGVDPMAQTAMPGAGGSGADLNLEGVGSGSGLLDLTRESDDTSLGAEIIDEINPGSGRSRPLGPPDTGSMSGVTLAPAAGGIVRGTTGVTVVQAKDPWELAFGFAALGAAVVVLFGLFALATSMYGVRPPDTIAWFGDKTLLIILAIGLAVPVLFGAFGKLFSMSAGR